VRLGWTSHESFSTIRATTRVAHHHRCGNPVSVAGPPAVDGLEATLAAPELFPRRAGTPAPWLIGLRGGAGSTASKGRGEPIPDTPPG
jgi:hypothetical protein